MICEQCKHYIPYDFYPYIGFCSLENKITFYDTECCCNFEPKVVEEIIEQQERVYCMTCKTWIYREDIDKHRSHKICINVVEDEVVHEESYAGD